MKSVFKYIFALLSLVSVVSACNNNSSSHKQYEEADLYGAWECNLNDSITSGKEIICFFPEKRFEVTDSLALINEEDGFRVNLSFVVHIQGSWSFNPADNMISVKYDSSSLNVTPDFETFSLEATGENADISAMESIKNEMAQELAGDLIKIYTDQYLAIADQEISLGAVLEADHKRLSLASNNGRLDLVRK